MWKLRLLQLVCRVIVHIAHYFDKPKEARAW